MNSRLHVHLTVDDLNASIAFYRSLLGEAPVKSYPDYAQFRPEGTPIHLALTPAPGRPGGRLQHLGLEVDSAEDLLALRRRLESGGLAFQEENEAACCYALADKLWAQDPDGNQWELWVRTGHLDQRDGLAAPVVAGAVAGAEAAGCAPEVTATAAKAGCCAPATDGEACC